MAHEITLTSRRSGFAAPRAELRIVHSSDLHVGEGFTEPLHKGDGTAGLRVVLAAARATKADALILAGDTFEHNRLSAALLDRAAVLLADAGIETVLLDQYTSVMEGSIGAIQRRLAVATDDYSRARRILQDAGEL